MKQANPVRRGEERRRSGHAIIEVALMMPWIIFLFLGIFNFGFYAYALISVENAARSGAIYTSSSAAMSSYPELTCRAVVEELRSLPGIGATAACACVGALCTAGAAGQIKVSSQLMAAGPDNDGPAAQVTVSYTTIDLFPLPWMAGKMTFVRIARMRI